jgi:hypothetical protein
MARWDDLAGFRLYGPAHPFYDGSWTPDDLRLAVSPIDRPVSARSACEVRPGVRVR